MNGHLVGHWFVSAGDYSFAYEESWLSSAHRRPISLSMPLRASSAPYRGEVVTNFFDNLLPDSNLVRRTLQTRLGLDSREPMALLEHLGRDCLGALQLLPLDQSGSPPDKIDGEPLSDFEIAEILRQLPRFPMGVDKNTEIRLSLAGNHEKTALLRHQGRWLRPIGPTPTTHILKLPIGVTPDGFDLSLSVENEWLCLHILGTLGFPVAHAEIADFEDQRSLVVTRFDRAESNGGLVRLPHEDLCQATGTAPAFKYESDGGPGIKQCLKLLNGSLHPADDRELFFKSQIAFWLLCAIDGHAKNFSLSILPLGRFKLAPLYDVLSAYPIIGHGVGKLPKQKATMAMAVWGKNRHYNWDRIFKRHWLKTAKDCGIPNPETLLSDLCSEVKVAARKVEESLPEEFPEQVAIPVLKGLLKASSSLE